MVYFAGWLTDFSGSYDMSLNASGVGIIISGFVLCFTPCLKKFDPLVRKKEEAEKIEEDNKSYYEDEENYGKLQKVHVGDVEVCGDHGEDNGVEKKKNGGEVTNGV